MTSNQPPDYDPLDDDRAPALSFKGAPIGTIRRVVVTSYARTQQSRNFDTREPEYWPADANGVRNPKMAVVISGKDEQGQDVSVWATIPSSMRNALAEAQKAAGQRIGPGGLLWIKFEGEEPPPPDKRHHNPKKIYKAVWQPGSAPPAQDALAQQLPAQQQYQQAPPVAAQPPAQGQQPPFQQAPPQQYQQPAQQQYQAAPTAQYQQAPPAQQQYQQAPPVAAQPPAQGQQPPFQQAPPAADPWSQAPPQGDPFAAMPAPQGDIPPF